MFYINELHVFKPSPQLVRVGDFRSCVASAEALPQTRGKNPPLNKHLLKDVTRPLPTLFCLSLHYFECLRCVSERLQL